MRRISVFLPSPQWAGCLRCKRQTAVKVAFPRSFCFHVSLGSCRIVDILRVVEVMRPSSAIEWKNVATQYNHGRNGFGRQSIHPERDAESLRRKWK
jgi:hypothetical protein